MNDLAKHTIIRAKKALSPFYIRSLAESYRWNGRLVEQVFI